MSIESDRRPGSADRPGSAGRPGPAGRVPRRRRVSHNTRAGRVFDVLNVIFLLALAMVTVLPFGYVVAGSFAGEAEIASRGFFVWPHQFSTAAYSAVFSTSTLLRSLIITVCVTLVGTLIHITVTIMMAYPLAKRTLPGRRLLLNLIIFCMVFTGGLIPTYLVVKGLGLIDSYWALILPAAVNPFYLMVVKSFFQELPPELEESARLDGCTEVGILWRILLPLSKPVIATFSLFYAVALWNDFMSPLLYINDSSKWTLQMFVRQVTTAAGTDTATALGNVDPSFVAPEQGIKFAVIVVATLPILVFYPFLQKHFAKGVLIGSVKG